MVEATCTPNSHIGDFDFLCSNGDCQFGPDERRSVLCKFCCNKEYSNGILVHCVCDTCAVILSIKPASNSDQDEEDKKEESDSDDDDKAWFKMNRQVIVQLPITLQLLAVFFRSNPQLFQLPGLFDATFSKIDFLLSQSYLSFSRKFGYAYFFADYFKSFLRHLLQHIKNPLIP